jgi:hypothetical protein
VPARNLGSMIRRLSEVELRIYYPASLLFCAFFLFLKTPHWNIRLCTQHCLSHSHTPRDMSTNPQSNETTTAVNKARESEPDIRFPLAY